MPTVTAKDVARAKRAAEHERVNVARARARYIATIREAVRDGVSQAEIARQLGVSRQYVGQLLRS